MRMNRGKKGFITVIFSRTTVFVLMLLAQLVFFLACCTKINQSFLYVYGIANIFGFFVILYIVNTDENPSFKISWIIPILLLPVFGTMIYLYIKTQAGSRVLNKRIQSIYSKTSKSLVQKQDILDELNEENELMGGLAHYMNEYAGYPVYKNTDVKYYPSGEKSFKELLEELKQAKKFIFVEYFIVAEGVMWDQILKILVDKVREGVEVRVMYDGMCSIFHLPYGYPEYLRKLGIKVKVFAPLRPFFTTRQNNRDHRKIIVVDGVTAFTGGINMSDEYINKKVRFGYWKDNGIRIKGEAAKGFTHMFLQLWNINETNIDNFETYCLPASDYTAKDDCYVCAYSDSPLDDEYVGKRVYLNIINSANKYVFIMTPYLVIDYEMEQALMFAAKRGVDVRILMPGIPDKKYAFCLARTYYPSLIKAGVKIFEYTPGFCHSKMFVSDDDICVVGSINLDFRSLFLHFECAALVYKSQEVMKCKEDFVTAQKDSHEVTLEECKNRKLYYKLLGVVFKLVAPLM